MNIGKTITIAGCKYKVLSVAEDNSGKITATVACPNNRAGKRAAIYMHRLDVWEWKYYQAGETRPSTAILKQMREQERVKAKAEKIKLKQKKIADKVQRIKMSLLEIQDESLRSALGSLVFFDLSYEANKHGFSLVDDWRVWNLHSASWLDYPRELITQHLIDFGYSDKKARELSTDSDKRRSA